MPGIQVAEKVIEKDTDKADHDEGDRHPLRMGVAFPPMMKCGFRKGSKIKRIMP